MTVAPVIDGLLSRPGSRLGSLQLYTTTTVKYVTSTSSQSSIIWTSIGIQRTSPAMTAFGRICGCVFADADKCSIARSEGKLTIS